MNNLILYARTFVISKGARSINYEGKRYFKRWVSPTLKELIKRKKTLGPEPEPNRSSFLEWNRSAEIFSFNKRLSEKFDKEKLEQALTHKSYIIEEQQKQRDIGIADPELNIVDNDDFIKKGKEYTSKIVKKYLCEALPNLPEEGIMKFHDYLLSEECLAKASRYIGTKDIILTAEFPVSEKTLADTFFALVAALVESVDMRHTSIFIRDFLITTLAEKPLADVWCPSNALETLNDMLLKQGKPSIESRFILQAGKNTLLAAYHVGVYSDKQFLGKGCGQTIQEAIEIAAVDALCRIYGLQDFSRPINFDKAVQIND